MRASALFLLLFSLVIPALLNLGTTNLLITSRFSEHRAAIYAADGATDAAMSRFEQFLSPHQHPINSATLPEEDNGTP